MKWLLDVTPQARRDLASILHWYEENLGSRAALKVARTVRSRLSAMEAGRLMGAELTPGSSYKRVVAKRHVIVFQPEGNALRVLRIVHGAQDLEQVAADLDAH
jgi:plasmid stabilization system protein ParE